MHDRAHTGYTRLMSPTVQKRLSEQHTPLGHYPKRRVQALLSKGAFEIVTMAASAGGVRALIQVLSCLPSDLPVPITIVQHVARDRPSLLPGILNRCSHLTVKEAEAGERLSAGAVYLAPSNRHLLVSEDGTVLLSDAERVNFARPAADPLFASVASGFGARAIAVVLTGAGKDGAAGASQIRRSGGIVLTQDRASSENFRMPDATIRAGAAHFVLPLLAIAPALITLTMVLGAAPHFGVGMSLTRAGRVAL